MESRENQTIEDALRMYQAISGMPLVVTTRFEDVTQALQRGETSILVELPWGEVRGGETHDRHIVVVSRIEAGRIYFVNGLKTKAPPGANLGGPGRGPARRAEPLGVESMPLAAFSALFERGGKAMLGQKP